MVQQRPLVHQRQSGSRLTFRISRSGRPARCFNRLLKKSDSCFDRLSTNGKSPTILSPPPFALSLSKGERRVFQHPDRASVASEPYALERTQGASCKPWHQDAKR